MEELKLRSGFENQDSTRSAVNRVTILAIPAFETPRPESGIFVCLRGNFSNCATDSDTNDVSDP